MTEQEKKALLDYAGEELDRFLYSRPQQSEPPRFRLCVDETLPEYAWSVRRSGDVVILAGHTERETLHAVYEVLGMLGFLFDTGTHAPEQIDFSGIKDRTVCPFVRLRGVRQHINFPMDISSYRQEEAEEYIRSLARMRMNAITFHSYDQMWHRGAGHLFYGQGYPLSSAGKYRSRIRENRELFFPPEGEQLIRDEARLNTFAVERLRGLIRVAKSVGLHVTVSMELSHAATVEELIAATRELLMNYPDMDELEFLSPEGGDTGPEMTPETMRDVIRQMFGAPVDDMDIPTPETISPQLPGALESIRRTLLVLERRREVFSGLREIPIRAGLYITEAQALSVTKRVMDRVLPPEIVRVFLPGHGAEYQCGLVRAMAFSPADYQNTVFHSWAEFDGNLYLLQNCSLGIAHLLELIGAESHADSVAGFYINHWRTIENAVCLSYTAEAMISRRTTADFYPEYAVRIGIPPAPFTEAMQRLERLDIENRERVFNIGFCYLNCWINPEGLSWLDGMEREGILHAMEEYTAIQMLLSPFAEQSPVADLLQNRAEASYYHLKGIGFLKDLIAYLGTSRPENLSAEQITVCKDLCMHAGWWFDRYAACLVNLMPDRGTEGTLISYLCTMPVYLEHIRTCVLPGKKKDACTHFAPRAAIIAPV